MKYLWMFEGLGSVQLQDISDGDWECSSSITVSIRHYW